jgi:hypothetical protein
MPAGAHSLPLHLCCRYGLPQLAEENLLDLIKSTKHHARADARLQLFGVFCGILPARPGPGDGSQGSKRPGGGEYIVALPSLQAPGRAGQAAGAGAGWEEGETAQRQQRQQEVHCWVDLGQGYRRWDPQGGGGD